jgi:hypothetical protein
VTALRWCAFGDLDSAVWGLAWVHGEAGAGHAVLGSGLAARVAAAELESPEPDREWRLHGDGFEIALSPAGDAAGGLVRATRGLVRATGSLVPATGGLVRATGTLTADGGDRSLDALGWRAALEEPPVPDQLDSLRLVAAWFGDDEGLALLAVRPRKARGHESDEVTAALIEAGAAGDVADARLSTTYSGDGFPARAGVELWVSEPAEDPEVAGERPDAAGERLHRLAGEVAGPPVAFADQGIEFSAQPFRWHSHGRDGAGVYLLGRPG